MANRVVTIVLLLPIWATAGDFPRELVEFKPFDGNPVFVAEGPGHWDAKIRERGWILRDGEIWRLWYTGYDGTDSGRKKLGYATSSDGVHWKRSVKNPVYDDHWVEDMMVVRDGDTFYMFAEGERDRAELLTSSDGVEWTWKGHLDVRKVDGSSINPGPYGTPVVFKEAGVWNLFYERGDLGVWLATSKDLDVWTNVTDEPVMRPGPDDYDGALIAFDQVIRHEGRYYAYYHGRGADSEHWCSCIAVSDDLREWKKYPQNPLLPLEEDKSSPVLVRDGNGFRLYTMHDKVDLHLPADEGQ